LKALVQRVVRGSVAIDGETVGQIGRGYVVLVGVRGGDTEKDVRYLAEKTVNLRVFADDEGRMNLSLRDIQGDVLVVSQFTLYASTRKGNRPSFVQAAKPELAESLYDMYVQLLRDELGEKRIATGQFGAMMTVEIINDGPVTIELISESSF
jgi:D-tyrosyl-tRNA(Tyr) deacylase